MRRIRGIFSVIRPEDGLLASFGVWIGWAVAARKFFPSEPLSLILASVSTFFLVGALNILNDMGDLDIDKLIHSKRALASGSISLGFSKFYLLGLLLASTILAISAAVISSSPLLLGIFTAGVTLGLLYEIRFKKRGLQGNIVIAVMVFLPLILGASIHGITPIVVILSIMAFLTALAKEIINDVKDVEGDKGHRSTLPNTVGVKPSLVYAKILLTSVIILSLVPVLMIGIDIPYLIFIGMADLLLLIVMFISYHKPVLAHRLHSMGMVLSLPAFLSLSI